MASSDNHIQDVIDAEIKLREKILVGMDKGVQKRLVELKLQPGEIVSRIMQIDGVLVEFERPR